MPYLLFLKKQQIRNCRLLQIIGGTLWVKIFFVLANNVNSDEMLHFTACHLGLYCLPMYLHYKGLNHAIIGNRQWVVWGVSLNMLGNSECFLPSTDFLYHQSVKQFESDQADILLGLIWVKTVCKCYLQTTMADEELTEQSFGEREWGEYGLNMVC